MSYKTSRLGAFNIIHRCGDKIVDKIGFDGTHCLLETDFFIGFAYDIKYVLCLKFLVGFHIIFMNMISGTFEDKSLQCHAWIYERGNTERLLILAFFQIPTYTTWSVRHNILRWCVHVQCLLDSGSPELRVWSSSAPFLNTSTLGMTIWAKASGTLHCGSQGAPTLFFETVRCRLFWAAHFLFSHFFFFSFLMHPTMPKDILSIFHISSFTV